MDRARRLASAEQVEQPRPGRVHAGRHGKPGRDHQRQQDKDDADVTEFLEDVVARRRRALRKAQSRVVLDVAPDVSPRPFGAADVKILAETIRRASWRERVFQGGKIIEAARYI